MSDLSKEGYHLRNRLAEIGVELTPDELSDGLQEALDAVGKGCRFCGDEDAETRYGMCIACFEKEEPS